ncbi:unnamed protein product [Scytosiphon promiscuus]
MQACRGILPAPKLLLVIRVVYHCLSVNTCVLQPRVIYADSKVCPPPSSPSRLPHLPAGSPPQPVTFVCCVGASRGTTSLLRGVMSTARVQIIAQPFPATRRSAAPARPASPRTDVGFDDALFLLVAEGRRPTRPEMLLFTLGFAASLSLVFMTSDLMNGKSVKPASIVVFFLSAFYCFVVIRRQRATAANLAAEEERSTAEARRPPPNVIDKETRHRLLNYFVLRPPEEEKKGDTSNGSSSNNTNNNNSVVAATGSRLGGSMFSLLSTPASVETHAPPPAYESPLPSTGMDSDGDGGSGEAQESSGNSSGGDQRPNDVENPETTRTAATAAATPAEAATATRMTDSPGDVAGGKEVGEGDRRCSSTSPRATNATGPGSGEAKGEWSTAGSCIVCFGDYVYGEELCRLPCLHVYHAKCIDEWLDGPNHGWCPLCKTDVVSAANFMPTSDGSLDTTTNNDNSSNNNNDEDDGGGSFSGRRWVAGTRRWRRHSTNNDSGENAV